jgi:hypothetical protein
VNKRKGDDKMYNRKSAAALIVDGVVAGTKLVAGLIELACEVDQTIETRKKTKELEKQTEIMKEETALRKEKLRVEIEEEKKRAAIMREKKLAEMTPEERADFEVNEILGRVKIRQAL